MRETSDLTETNPEGQTARIVFLIAALASPRAARRHDARLALEAIGNPAVGHLIQGLGDMKNEVRSEAIRALGNIGDAEAVPALIRELEDESSACRWLAAESLATIGAASLAPLLELLAEGVDSFEVRRGVLHVLHALEPVRPTLLGPVLAAFQSDVPEIAIRGAASTALVELEAHP
ncbi:MAG: HEAT repeat domain-containing protein [Synechococcaceae cyanobacterium]|nr:HEAT repeat domain-containing protein [Synechococcaceae cyanobacterium]